MKNFVRRPISAKRFVVSFILAFFGFFIFWTLLVYCFDPYLYYHRNWVLKNVYDNSRAMVPGVMRNFEYDTVLFGNSMCQNFRCSEIDEALQVKCVKATSAGLSAAAFSRYFDTAVRYGGSNFRRCIAGIDIWSFCKDDESRKSSYPYLYEDRIFPVEYFYSVDTASAIWDMIRLNISADFDHIARHQLDEDVMFSNKPRYTYSRETLEHYVRESEDLPQAIDDKTLERFEKYLFANVRNHPEMQFDFFLPPYSIYFWCLLRSENLLESYLAMRDTFARLAAAYPNVRVHDFQADFDIVCELDFYKDVTHYSPRVNSLIVLGIKSGEYIFELDEFRRRTALIRERSAEYQSTFDRLRSGRQ